MKEAYSTSDKSPEVNGYKQGQKVICRILCIVPGGYDVVDTNPDMSFPGFLPSNASYEPGELVETFYVCWDRDRILVSERELKSNMVHWWGGETPESFLFDDGGMQEPPGTKGH